MKNENGLNKIHCFARYTHMFTFMNEDFTIFQLQLITFSQSSIKNVNFNIYFQPPVFMKYKMNYHYNLR